MPYLRPGEPRIRMMPSYGGPTVVTPSIPPNSYVTENGVTPYVTEDGVTPYVTES
jgi:hypothetical protein